MFLLVLCFKSQNFSVLYLKLKKMIYLMMRIRQKVSQIGRAKLLKDWVYTMELGRTATELNIEVHICVLQYSLN